MRHVKHVARCFHAMHNGMARSEQRLELTGSVRARASSTPVTQRAARIARADSHCFSSSGHALSGTGRGVRNTRSVAWWATP
eukprot:8533697-Lingulodinium_polyedra.AAC.1